MTTVFSDETIHDASDGPDLSLPDTSKVASTCWILNPIDFGLEEFCFNLLIIYLFDSFLEFGFCTNEIRSSVSANFPDWSSSTDETSKGVYKRIRFHRIRHLYVYCSTC